MKLLKNQKKTSEILSFTVIWRTRIDIFAKN